MTMPNRFAGICYRCGGAVAAGEGVFEYETCPGTRWPEGKFQRNWPMIEHSHCQTRFAGTNVHYLWSPHHESA